MVGINEVRIIGTLLVLLGPFFLSDRLLGGLSLSTTHLWLARGAGGVVFIFR